jgi:hypothetical protein
MQSKETSPARSSHTLDYPDILSDFVSNSLRRGTLSDTRRDFDDLRGLLKTLSEWDGGIDSCPSADFFNDLRNAIIWVERPMRKRREPTLREAVNLLDRRRSRLGVGKTIESAYNRVCDARRCLPFINWLIDTGRWWSPETQELLKALRGGYITEQHWHELMGPFRESPEPPKRERRPRAKRCQDSEPLLELVDSRSEILVEVVKKEPSWMPKMRHRESTLRLWPFFAFLLESGFYGKEFIDLEKKKNHERLLGKLRKRKQRENSPPDVL